MSSTTFAPVATDSQTIPKILEEIVEAVSSDNESEKSSKVSKSKFAGKYNKFKYFAHWFVEEMKSKHIITTDQGKNMLSELCFYGSVDEQNEVYSAFIDTNPKFSVTAINKAIREEINLTKPKKVKELDVDAPQKKRGRKKKQIEDSSSEEEKLLSAIVDAKNADFVEPVVEAELTEEPMVEAEEPMVEAEEPVVEAKEPVVEAKEPMVEAEEPVVEAKEPVVEPEMERPTTPVLPCKVIKKRAPKKKEITVTAEQLAIIDSAFTEDDELDLVTVDLGDKEYQVNAEHILFDLDDKEVGKIENGVVVLK
jgi:hypothetical protein